MEIVVNNQSQDEKYNLEYSVDTGLTVDGYYQFPGDIQDILEPWRSDNTVIPLIFVYALTFVIGIVGNSVVVFGMLGDKKSKSVTTLFLVSLALADLIFLVICVPCELIRRFFINYIPGGGLCKVLGFVEMLSGVASVLNLTAVSAERYVVILYPMKARSLFTMGSTKKILALVWMVSIVLASPVLHVTRIEISPWYQNITAEGGEHVITKVKMAMCVDDIDHPARKAFGFYQLFIMFIIPTLIMTLCYSKVVQVLWISTKELAKMTGNDGSRRDDDSKHQASITTPLRDGSQKKGVIKDAAKEHSASVQQARKQVIKMLIMVVVIFFVCWGPRLILNLLIKYQSPILYMHGSDTAKMIINLLPYIQSNINPIIYCFMSSNFRRSMRYSCRTYCYLHLRGKDRSEFELETRSNGTGLTSPYSQSTVRKPPRRQDVTTDGDFVSVTVTDNINNK